MAISAVRSPRGYRRHGVRLEPADRRALERSGWRTTLEYRENHVRGRDGRLLEVEESWTAEAERFEGAFQVVAAEATTADEAWALLRDAVEIAQAQLDPQPRVRLIHP